MPLIMTLLGILPAAIPDPIIGGSSVTLFLVRSDHRKNNIINLVKLISVKILNSFTIVLLDVTDYDYNLPTSKSAKRFDG